MVCSRIGHYACRLPADCCTAPQMDGNTYCSDAVSSNHFGRGLWQREFEFIFFRIGGKRVNNDASGPGNLQRYNRRDRTNWINNSDS